MVLDTLEYPKLATDKIAKREMVLVVDDDEALADVLSRRLAQQGFDTKTADSGRQGLAVARSDHPDLIVLDLRLPDTDGFTICEKLADSIETCNIPIIILSGMARPDIIRRSRSAGCHYFVRKPYDPNALLVLIRQAIDEANGWSGMDE
jgi:two-component system response regulator VicR